MELKSQFYVILYECRMKDVNLIEVGEISGLYLTNHAIVPCNKSFLLGNYQNSKLRIITRKFNWFFFLIIFVNKPDLTRIMDAILLPTHGNWKRINYK